QQNVRPALARKLQRLLAVGRLPHHLDVWIALERRDHGCSHQWEVVGDEHPNPHAIPPHIAGPEAREASGGRVKKSWRFSALSVNAHRSARSAYAGCRDALGSHGLDGANSRAHIGE